MGFERIFVGEELCCHSAIQLLTDVSRPKSESNDQYAVGVADTTVSVI
jgi:hypothetical protein